MVYWQRSRWETISTVWWPPCHPLDQKRFRSWWHPIIFRCRTSLKQRVIPSSALLVWNWASIDPTRKVLLTDLLTVTQNLSTKPLIESPGVASESWRIYLILASFATNFSCNSASCARVLSKNSSSCVISAVAFASSFLCITPRPQSMHRHPPGSWRRCFIRQSSPAPYFASKSDYALYITSQQPMISDRKQPKRRRTTQSHPSRNLD